MILVTVIFVSAVVGQLEAPEVGKPVFVDLKAEDAEDFYGICIKVDGDIWQFQYNNANDQSTRKAYNRQDIFDWEYEDPESVQQRFDEYYTSQGLVKVPTQSGWIPKEQYEFAQNAREAALAMVEQRQRSESDDTLIAEVMARSAVEQDEKPSYLTLWGPQAALALGSLILVGIIVKLVILSGEQTAKT